MGEIRRNANGIEVTIHSAAHPVPVIIEKSGGWIDGKKLVLHGIHEAEGLRFALDSAISEYRRRGGD